MLPLPFPFSRGCGARLWAEVLIADAVLIVHFSFGIGFAVIVVVIGDEMMGMCHTQTRRLRRPRSTKFDIPPPLLILLQHQQLPLILLLLRNLLFIP
jgi:hypothetical protein